MQESNEKQGASGVPLDKIVMPVALTAENGARGEWSDTPQNAINYWNNRTSY